MKRTILTSIMAVCMFSSQAQETSTPDSFKPQAGEKQFTFGLFNNSSFFAIKKYKTPKRATRFGISGNYLIESTHNLNTYYNDPYVDPYSSSIQDMYTKRSDFWVDAFLGFQRGFSDFKSFEPYVGVDFSLGNRFENRKTDYTYNNYNYQPIYTTKATNKYSNNLNPSASVLPFIGFNYYLGERFALGAEYKISVLNFTYNAKSNSETNYTLSDGNSFSNTNKGYDNFRVEGNFRGSAYITATLFINSAKK